MKGVLMFRKILSIMGVLLVLTLLFAGCSSDEKTTNAPADTHTYLHVPFPVDSYFENVRSLSVTVTAADIDSPITAVDTTIQSTSQSDIMITIPAGADRHFEVAALDSSGQQLYRTQLDATVNSGARTDIAVMLFAMGYGAPTKVKLFRDTPPWGTVQPESVLMSMGFTQGAGANQYQVFNSSQMGSIVLTPGIDLVIFQAYQETTYYKNYLANRAFFETFVQDGGTMFFLYATDIGNRSDSAVNMIFPGGVDYTFHTNGLNHPVIMDHPITAGIAHDLPGSSASHGYFDSLVAGTLILTVDSDSNPTLMIYGYGQGTVVLSGQPLEFARYHRSTWAAMSTLLSRVIRFILGYDPTPEPLPKAEAPHRAESSTSIR